MKKKITPPSSELPLISKDDFIKTIDLMKSMDHKFKSLQDAMEELSPGSYVDFWPHLTYDGAIMKLLAILMKEPLDTISMNIIELFCMDWNYGDSVPEYPEYYIDDDKPIKPLHTPAELYDYLVELNFTTPSTSK